uniref:Uncharacterized protein n=1 Tax=Rhizophora mucronata TaxID=61149 RepID=A0A2P2PKR9_RHIMU
MDFLVLYCFQRFILSFGMEGLM